MNDVVINKIQSIQRCVERARAEYNKNPERFPEDFSVQDAAVLNILRGCEQAIDLANYMVTTYKLGLPNSSADSFDLLCNRSVIERSLADRLKKMVGFRNMAVHQYDKLNIAIVVSVITKNLDDLIRFGDKIMEYLKDK